MGELWLPLSVREGVRTLKEHSPGKGARVEQYITTGNAEIATLRARVEELGEIARNAEDSHVEAEERAEAADVERARLRDAGRALATCAFNLKQRDHLTESERRSLSESQEEWDAAIAPSREVDGG